MMVRAHSVNAVSPAARSASASVPAVASKSCHAADSINIRLPARSRSAEPPSPTKGENSKVGITRYEIPTSVCHVPAVANVIFTMRGTSSLAPAPIACPTRIAPALATPNAGMNERLLICMTAIIAASAVVPSPATTTFTKMLKA